MTAAREYEEEASLPSASLQVLENVVFVDNFGCHYFAAEWVNDENNLESRSGSPGCHEGWRPTHEDPLDKDPITWVQWMCVNEALREGRLSAARKKLLQLVLKERTSSHVTVTAQMRIASTDLRGTDLNMGGMTLEGAQVRNKKEEQPRSMKVFSSKDTVETKMPKRPQFNKMPARVWRVKNSKKSFYD